MTAILSNPYMYLLAGMLIYLIIDFGTFKRSVDLTYHQAFEQYFDLNWYWLLSGVLIGLIIVSMKDIGRLVFLDNIGFDVTKSPESAFMLGLLNQWVVIKLRKFVNATRTETKHDQVVQVKNSTNYNN